MQELPLLQLHSDKATDSIWIIPSAAIASVTTMPSPTSAAASIPVTPRL